MSPSVKPTNRSIVNIIKKIKNVSSPKLKLNAAAAVALFSLTSSLEANVQLNSRLVFKKNRLISFVFQILLFLLYYLSCCSCIFKLCGNYLFS